MGAAALRHDPDVEVAFARAYGGLDPATLGLRRFMVLFNGLPAGAWPDREHQASWSQESHLLAATIDAVNNLAWTVVAVNAEQGQRPQRPKPVDRPGARQVMSWADLASRMGGGT